MRPGMVGDITWNDQEWIKVFKNFVKIGLSENIGASFLALSKGFESLKFFQVLIRIQEEIIPNILIPLKIEKWQLSAFEILKYFLLEGPINTVLISKILPKFTKIVFDIYKSGSLMFTEELLSLLQHLLQKYSQSSIAPEIEKEFTELAKLTNINTEQIISKKYSINSWTKPIQTNQQEQPNIAKMKYRGLQNLGNSIYYFDTLKSISMLYEQLRSSIIYDKTLSLSNAFIVLNE
jgi:hypothetical protein